MSFPRKLPTHLLIALTSAIGVWGCSKTNINAQGFGGSDQWAVMAAESPVKLAAAIRRLRTQGDPEGRLCNLSLCGNNPFVCSQLASLAATPEEDQFVRNSLQDDALLSSLEGGLATMQPSMTDKDDDVLLSGVAQDALTIGNVVKFLRRRVVSKAYGDFLALVYHEATHVAGIGDGGSRGPMSARRWVDARASCLVPFALHSISTDAALASRDNGGGKGGANGGSGGGSEAFTRFSDHFDRADLGANWWTIAGPALLSGGFLGVSGPGSYDFAYANPNAIVTDVQLTGSFNLADGSDTTEVWGELYGRSDKNGVRYAARAVVYNGNLTVGIWKREMNASRTNLALQDLGAISQQEATGVHITFEAQGASLRLYYREQLKLEVIDTSTVASGWVGVSGAERAKVDFFGASRL